MNSPPLTPPSKRAKLNQNPPATTTSPIPEDLKLNVNDGVIDGGALMYALHSVIQKKLQDVNPWNFYDKPNQTYSITEGSQWLCTAGRLAAFIAAGNIDPTSEEKQSMQNFPLCLYVGELKTKIKLEIENKTERISFVEKPSFLNSAKNDLTYTQIIDGINTLKEKCGVTDSCIAFAILQKINKCDNVILSISQISNRDYNHFINFLITLLVGLEASRNNSCFGTSLMILELIKAGKINFDKAFNTNDNEKLAYPMATSGTGSGNLSRRGDFFKHYPNNKSNENWIINRDRKSVV